MRYVPPAQRPGRPQGTPERLRRMVHMEEARHREEDRPFDPGAQRESYAKPHHFAVNAGHSAARALHLPGHAGHTLCGEESHAATLVPSVTDSTCHYCAQEWERQFYRGREARHTPNAPYAPAEMDRHAATELVLFIENTADLALEGPHGQGRSVLLNALRKFRKGTYDSAMAVKLFEYLTEAGARRYAQQNQSSMPWNQRFSVSTRREAARQLEASFRSAAEQGEYDEVDTRIGAR